MADRRKDRYKDKEYKKKHYAANKERYRDQFLQKTYDMTLDEYKILLVIQQNCCAICGKKETAVDKRWGTKRVMAVDHDHKTGKIRGLLCGACNARLGTLENVNWVAKALRYLREVD